MYVCPLRKWGRIRSIFKTTRECGGTGIFLTDDYVGGKQRATLVRENPSIAKREGERKSQSRSKLI